MFEGRVRYVVEADEVYPAVEGFQQFQEGVGMRYGVVETTKEDVFERQPALFGAFIVAFVSLPAEIVAFEHVHYVLRASCLPVQKVWDGAVKWQGYTCFRRGSVPALFPVPRC